MPEYDNFMKWWGLLKPFKGKIPWIILLASFLFAMFYPERVQLWASFFQRLFANISSRMSKKSIENELQSRVLDTSKKVCKDIDEVLPYKIRIDWVKATSKETFFDDNQVVICMDHNKTRNQNIIYAINDYVEHGLFPIIKYHLDPNVMKSSRLILTKKLLSVSYKKGLAYFMQNIFYNEMRNEEIKQLVEELIRLDDSGMFVQILLREFLNKGNKYAIGLVNESFQQESSAFLNYLYEIANREKGQTCKLKFHGKFYKVGLMLVAKTDTYDEHGLNAYIYRFKDNIRNGIEDIYLCSRGDIKVNIALSVAKTLRKTYKNLEKPKVFNYTGRYKNHIPYKGICVAFNNIRTS